jgi:energy-converting hydrogenase A subunit M
VSDAQTAGRLQDLLDRLEGARQRLEAAEDSDAAVDVLQDLVQLAKEVQAEIERQKGTP